jgi:CheY-like chemotaxis protein
MAKEGTGFCWKQQPPRGACALPRKDVEMIDIQPNPDQAATGRGLRALVVEDFKTMRRVVTQTLGSIGVETIEAGNGIEALDLLDKQEVQIVFTDLVMPEMDGFELCEEIRRRPNVRGLPVVVISTHRDAKYVIQALRKGADDYLTKPFNAQVAQKIIERVMSYV